MNPHVASLLASILFVALAWEPGAAHLLELPAKVRMARDDYVTVQRIYRGWALLGTFAVGAVTSTAAFAWISLMSLLWVAARMLGGV